MTFPETMLQFEVLEDNCMIALNPSELDGSKYYFSTDNISWDSNPIIVNRGTIVGIKGSNYPKGSRFSINKPINIYGSIMSLVDGIGEQTEITEEQGFRYLFADINASINIKGNLLSATTLAKSCYESMFRNNFGLTSIPENLLPATTLAERCYYGMFNGCGNLISIPKDLLPATTLAEGCYYNMFNGCINLTSIPSGLLPAMTLAKDCYNDMFYWCESLTSIPKGLLPATTLAENCYAYMFGACESLTSFPEGVLAEPTTYANNCYKAFLIGDSSLKEISVPFKSWPPQECTSQWVERVAAEGDFYCPSELPVEFGVNRIPTSWTVNPLPPIRVPVFNTITFKNNLVASWNKWNIE